MRAVAATDAIVRMSHSFDNPKHHYPFSTFDNSAPSKIMSANSTTGESNKNASTNPFEVLGLSMDADEDTVRARYLELVRQYPPDRDPAMFTKIRQAYEGASDPIVMARRMIEAAQADPKPWSDLLDEQAQRPPRLPLEVLLSLGNRSLLGKSKPTDGPATTPDSTETTAPDS